MALAAAFALSTPLGACSLSYQLGDLASKAPDQTEHTGSVPAKPSRKQTASSDLPLDGDLALTRAAVNEVLSRDEADTSLPWENPSTGARGTVTPITTAYNQDGFTCRDFLASYVREGSEAWLQGEACRMHEGKWQVKNLRSWKST